eukprot:Sspe_Gene.41718::Locus_20190_Transcript_2_2_Confidence_0.500_Length_2512::g.41718::m.41718
MEAKEILPQLANLSLRGKGYGIAKLRHVEAPEVRDADSVGQFTPAATFPIDKELRTKAQNLRVHLPPVNTELNRLKQMVHTDPMMIPPTTFGNVLLGSKGDDDAPRETADSGVPFVPTGRSLEPVTKKQDTDIASRTQMTRNLRMWSDEVEVLRRRDDDFEEYERACGIDSEDERDLRLHLQSTSQTLQAMETKTHDIIDKILENVQGLVGKVEAIKSVHMGIQPVEHLDEVMHVSESDRGDDDQVLFRRSSGTPQKANTAEKLMSVGNILNRLSDDLHAWATELRSNPDMFSMGGGGEASNLDHTYRPPEFDHEEDEADQMQPIEGGSRILQAAREAEMREERYDEGIRAAALAVGITLSKQQVAEILNEFYRQPRQLLSVPMRKKQKLRLERRYITVLKREAEQVRRLKDTIEDLRKQLAEKRAQEEAEVDEELAVETGVQASERFRKERAIVDSMASRKVRELESRVQELEDEYRNVSTANEESLELFDKLKTDYDTLLSELMSVKKRWVDREEQFKEREQEIERLQQGKRRDDQVWRSRLLEVTRAVTSAMSCIPEVLTKLLTHVKSTSHVDKWRSDAVEALMGGLAASLQLVNSSISHVPQEGYRHTLDEVRAMILAHQAECAEGSGADSEGSKPTPLRNTLVEQLQERMEVLATENRSKFREARYMKSTIAYVCKTVESIINGTYEYGRDDTPEEGARSGDFPPFDVVKYDKDYAYAWIDEKKMLQDMLGTLKLYIRHGGAKPNSVNSLIAVLGSWKEAVQTIDKDPKTISGQTWDRIQKRTRLGSGPKADASEHQAPP